MDRVQALKDVGVIIHHDSHYEGEPRTPERHEVIDQDTVRSLLIPLSAEEWCSIAMREGDDYVGGCCGNTGVMQDNINEAFRNSGFIDNHDLLTIGFNARGHEGFDTFNKLDDSEFEQLITEWEHLDPWDKIGLIYNGVEPMLKPASHETPREVEDQQDVVLALSAGLSYLSWNSLFSVDDESRAHTDKANRLQQMAKILPMLRELLQEMEQTDEVFEGYAIVAEGSDTLMFGPAGLTMYGTLDDAKEALEIWDRARDDVNCELRKVSVSVADGVVLGPVLSATL